MLVLKNSKFLIKDNSYLYILLDCWMSNQYSLQVSCARTIKSGTILCYNLPRDELWLVKVCPFTNHNSLCGELWHKVVSLSVVPVFFYVDSWALTFQLYS